MSDKTVMDAFGAAYKAVQAERDSSYRSLAACEETDVAFTELGELLALQAGELARKTDTIRFWLAANGPGGWISELREAAGRMPNHPLYDREILALRKAPLITEKNLPAVSRE